MSDNSQFINLIGTTDGRHRYDLFGSLPDTIEDEWIQDIEHLDEYVSDKPVTISEFRAIQLMVRKKGLAIEARHRYWAQR